MTSDGLWPTAKNEVEHLKHLKRQSGKALEDPSNSKRGEPLSPITNNNTVNLKKKTVNRKSKKKSQDVPFTPNKARPSGDPMTDSAMPKMIFPTRKLTEAPNGQPTSTVHPVGTNPLAWIESISTEAEKQDSRRNRGRAVAPIRVHGMSLSFKHPALAKETESQVDPPETYGLKEGGQRKRVRVEQEHGSIPSIPALAKEDNNAWDLSHLTQDLSQPTRLVRRVQDLARAVEAKEEMSPSAMASYGRIKSQFSLTLSQTVAIEAANGGVGTAQTTGMLNALYNETVQKLEVLLELLESEATKYATATGPEEATDVDTASEQGTHTPVPKKDFAKYMMQWLRDNWTNPYPDDEGLAKIASDCDTTTTIVGNWLINARTRKWRPAIVKAFKNNRPSEVLLEDSLNIFDDHPVRQLEAQSSDSNDFQDPRHKRTKRGA